MKSLRQFVPAPIRRFARPWIAPFIRQRPQIKWVGIESIASEFAKAQAAGPTSSVAFLDAIRSFWVRLPPPPGDPWSAAYREHWLDVYRQLTGRDYATHREGHVFDVAAMIETPFPYSSESYEIVGQQLIGVGSVIRAMQLPPRASILEFGPGWGNTSLALAQMGYRVTVIDIEERFLQLLAARAAKLGVELDAIHGDFLSAPRDRSFDAVLFYESFHHCHDHLALLDMLPDMLAPNGKLVLAGETVNESIPYDWGLNPNGEAIWEILENGWFELAFRESYLLKTLMHKGWAVHKYDSHTAAGVVYVCSLVHRPPAT